MISKMSINFKDFVEIDRIFCTLDPDKKVFRYGRRTAFFVMLLMEVVLSMAMAFSPNYIVYTIIR